MSCLNEERDRKWGELGKRHKQGRLGEIEKLIKILDTKLYHYCSNCVNLHKFNTINSIIWENFGLNVQKVPVFLFFIILHSTDVNAWNKNFVTDSSKF